MTRNRWTLPMLRRAVAAVESGRTWDDVAADFGVLSATLRRTMRRYGFWPDAAKRAPKRHPQEMQLVRAVKLRRGSRMSWPVIANAIGWTGAPESLSRAAHRRARREGIDLQ